VSQCRYISGDDSVAKYLCYQANSLKSLHMDGVFFSYKLLYYISKLKQIQYLDINIISATDEDLYLLKELKLIEFKFNKSKHITDTGLSHINLENLEIFEINDAILVTQNYVNNIFNLARKLKRFRSP